MMDKIYDGFQESFDHRMLHDEDLKTEDKWNAIIVMMLPTMVNFSML